MPTLPARQLALHCVRIAEEKGGEELKLLEFPTGTAVFDFCLLVSARSDRQLQAIAGEIHRFCKTNKLPHHPVEGESGWLLIDCLDVVVHAFSSDERRRYRLDTLWPQATVVDNVSAEAARLAAPSAVVGD